MAGMSESKAEPITPSIGRVVLYYPRGVSPPQQPCRADVCFVHPDGRLNINWHTHEGIGVSSTSVLLVQPGEEPPKSGQYCFWMPFQVRQTITTLNIEEKVEKIENDIKAVLSFVKSESGRQAGWRGMQDLKLDEFRTRMLKALRQVKPGADVRPGDGEPEVLMEKEANDEKVTDGPGPDASRAESVSSGTAVPTAPNSSPEPAGPSGNPPEPAPEPTAGPGSFNPAAEPPRPTPPHVDHPKRKHSR